MLYYIHNKAVPFPTHTQVSGHSRGFESKVRSHREFHGMKKKQRKRNVYKDLQKVYTIIFYEQSIEVFKEYPEVCTHHARMVCDSGLELNFLQEFYLVALDVFRKSEYAKSRDPKDRQVGWLSFFCTENAEDAEALCEVYPWLWELYAEMAEFGRKPEELIAMFSEILREMDRNTIRYMVDDLNEKVEQRDEIIAAKNETIAKKDEIIAEKEEALAKAREEIVRLRTQLEEK